MSNSGTGNASSDWDQGLPDGQTRGCAEDVVIALVNSPFTIAAPLIVFFLEITA